MGNGDYAAAEPGTWRNGEPGTLVRARDWCKGKNPERRREQEFARIHASPPLKSLAEKYANRRALGGVLFKTPLFQLYGSI
jgi:hypothetical protein